MLLLTPGPAVWAPPRSSEPPGPVVGVTAQPHPGRVGGGLSSSLLGMGLPFTSEEGGRRRLYARHFPGGVRLTSREDARVHEGGHAEVGQHEEEDDSIVGRNDRGDIQAEPRAPAGNSSGETPRPCPTDRSSGTVLRVPPHWPHSPHGPGTSTFPSSCPSRWLWGSFLYPHPVPTTRELELRPGQPELRQVTSCVPQPGERPRGAARGALW